MLGGQYGIEGLPYSGRDVWTSKEMGLGGTTEAGRQIKGGHSGSVTLKVARISVMSYGGYRGGSMVGRGAARLGRVFRPSGGGWAATWWHRLGADCVKLWGHLLCFWIMSDC